MSYPGTRKIIARYEAGGMKALAPQTRGRRPGDKRALSAEQEARIRQLICDKRPEQLKMEFALWSRIAVGQLLRRWGFPPQKPIQRAYEPYPAKVRQ